MKVEKILKKLRKNPEFNRLAIDGDVVHVPVGAKDRALFRFVRDQLEGKDAARVNYAYGIGGRMEIFIAPTELAIQLYNDSNRKFDRITLARETAAA